MPRTSHGSLVLKIVVVGSLGDSGRAFISSEAHGTSKRDAQVEGDQNPLAPLNYCRCVDMMQSKNYLDSCTVLCASIFKCISYMDACDKDTF